MHMTVGHANICIHCLQDDGFAPAMFNASEAFVNGPGAVSGMNALEHATIVQPTGSLADTMSHHMIGYAGSACLLACLQLIRIAFC